jgi:hypothetical protein
MQQIHAVMELHSLFLLFSSEWDGNGFRNKLINILITDGYGMDQAP